MVDEQPPAKELSGALKYHGFGYDGHKQGDATATGGVGNLHGDAAGDGGEKNQLGDWRMACVGD